MVQLKHRLIDRIPVGRVSQQFSIDEVEIIVGLGVGNQYPLLRIKFANFFKL